MVHHSTGIFSSQHNRRLRSLVLCPVDNQLFVTSALDGRLNLWQSSRLGISLVSTADASSGQKRWPEDMAWHPEGNALFSVYRVGYEDHQVSITDLTRAQGVGGSDHAVILWNMDDQTMCKPMPLHWNIHTSAVMGVAGMHQNQVVLSAGKDRRILGYDAHVCRQRFVQQLDSSCLGVLPNPRFKQEQNGRHFIVLAGNNKAVIFSLLWSSRIGPPTDSVSSGSADPMIHIFDIRYNGCTPSQSVKAHEKRVFKAMWLPSDCSLISTSADNCIGLHKFV